MCGFAYRRKRSAAHEMSVLRSLDVSERRKWFGVFSTKAL